MTAIRLTREERDALYEQALERLSGIDRIFLAVQAETFERARRFSLEIADDLALLDRLGWGDPLPCEGIELAMPAEQIQRLFVRIRDDAEAVREESDKEAAEAIEGAVKLQRRAEQVAATSARILGGVRREADEL